MNVVNDSAVKVVVARHLSNSIMVLVSVYILRSVLEKCDSDLDIQCVGGVLGESWGTWHRDKVLQDYKVISDVMPVKDLEPFDIKLDVLKQVWEACVLNVTPEQTY